MSSDSGTPEGMDDQLRRQLRFSMILQIATAGMLAVACVVRLLTSGPDALAVIFGIGALLAGGFAWYLRTRLARPEPPS